jgi:hypothetical protein
VHKAVGNPWYTSMAALMCPYKTFGLGVATNELWSSSRVKVVTYVVVKGSALCFEAPQCGMCPMANEMLLACTTGYRFHVRFLACGDHTYGKADTSWA